MSLKTWMLSGMNRAFTRADLPAREPVHHPTSEPRVEPGLRSGRTRGAPVTAEHLGRYGPLIGAIREELEDFVDSHLRLHLAIAERDRYLLLSIEVESTGSEEVRDLLTRFTHEFAPEQVKQFLAKEVIARLPNANAIDLSQFGGIEIPSEERQQEKGIYADLMDELRRTDAPRNIKPYKITLVGRWSQADARSAASMPRRDVPTTPIIGREMAVDIEDGSGSRRVEFSAVPGRRYVVGKEEGCDVVVNGVYASRRHCEIWLDHGKWWVTDSGSTNGIRVEDGHGASSASSVSVDGDGAILAIPSGARIVLSAAGRGSVADYPRLQLHDLTIEPATGIAQLGPTPVTPIVPRRAGDGLALHVETPAGERTVDVPLGSAAISAGRSRNQHVVIDWLHQGVSGHHVDIVDCDVDGATVVVHGDNGVDVGGTLHPAGTRFRWALGRPMILGRPIPGEPSCTLTLTRPS